MDSLKRFSLVTLSGLLIGASVSLFLHLLSVFTDYRLTHPKLSLLLPFAGLGIAWLYSKAPSSVSEGQNFILGETHAPNHKTPWQMAPWILFTTLLTHLFGGSAGREGTAVQIGACLADQFLPRGLNHDQRKRVLLSGLGAGFGASVGAPWAGMIFGMEISRGGALELRAWRECALSSWCAVGATLLLQTPHTLWTAEPPHFVFDWWLAWLPLPALMFGLTSRSFNLALKHSEILTLRLFPNPLLRAFFGGALLALILQVGSLSQYSGLGLETIQSSLALGSSSWEQPLLKSLLTVLTLGVGFKGGEFVPLVFVGTTLGACLDHLLEVPFGFFSVLGFGAVFAGAANAPLTCSVMLGELFGWQWVPFALGTFYLGYIVSGKSHSYGAQSLPKWKMKLLVR